MAPVLLSSTRRHSGRSRSTVWRLPPVRSCLGWPWTARSSGWLMSRPSITTSVRSRWAVGRFGWSSPCRILTRCSRRHWRRVPERSPPCRTRMGGIWAAWLIRSAITGRSVDRTHEALLEPHRQSHSRHRSLNRRVDLPGPTGVRLPIDPLERVARRAVQPPRQADVEAEPQVDREPRMAAARELRRREVIGDPHVHLGRREASGRGAARGGVERQAHDACFGRELTVARGRAAPEAGALIAEPRGHLAIGRERELRTHGHRDPLGRSRPGSQDEQYHARGRAAHRGPAPLGLGSGTRVSCTCWRRATFSFAMSWLRRAIWSRNSRLYRMLAAAGRGAGFRSVMTKPVTSAAPPTTASSRLELEPKLELSSPSVPTSAPPV